MINDSQKDSFARHKETPHLGTMALEEPKPPAATALERELRESVAAAAHKEDLFDALRLFKRSKIRGIAALESDPIANRRRILTELAIVADAIIRVAYDAIASDMPARWGRPTYLSSYKQILPSSLAVVGLGKLGAREMNYESDVDLVFIYSHVGETSGKEPVSNAQYFAKFAQKFLGILSVQTSAGRCYESDVELRPSGNAGTLVTSLDHFLDHQMNHAQEWERLAGLRARVIAQTDDFKLPLTRHLDELSFGRALPPGFFQEMRAVRERVLTERVREAPRQYDLKLGRGGLMDVEFAAQGFQLKDHAVYPDLRQRGIFPLVDALKQRGIPNPSDAALLEEAYLWYRTVESQLHLLRQRPEHIVHEDSDDFAMIAERLKLANRKDLRERLDYLRSGVTRIFESLYQPCP